MSKLVPKDEAGEFRPWSPPSMDAGVPATASAAPSGLMLTASQIEELQKQAYDEAYQVGLEEGRAAGRDELQNRIRQFEQLMSTLGQPLRDLDDQVEQELVSLVIALVRQMVRRELRADPGQVVAVVREAMAVLPAASQRVSVHLHPEDAALVRETLSLSLSEEERSWTVVEDPIQSRGGCRVITEHSQVDASVESRLAQVIASAFGGERQSDNS